MMHYQHDTKEALGLFLNEPVFTANRIAGLLADFANEVH